MDSTPPSAPVADLRPRLSGPRISRPLILPDRVRPPDRTEFSDISFPRSVLDGTPDIAHMATPAPFPAAATPPLIYTKSPGDAPLPGYRLIEPLGRGGFGE